MTTRTQDDNRVGAAATVDDFDTSPVTVPADWLDQVTAAANDTSAFGFDWDGWWTT